MDDRARALAELARLIDGIPVAMVTTRANDDRLGSRPMLLERQEPDGWWHPLVEETLGDVIEITLEFVMHLDTLIGALVSRGGFERGGSRSAR